MKLTLIVDNTNNLESGTTATSVFDHNGGIIGSADNTHWQLLDRSRSVEHEHVRIFFSDGSFCAEPLSRDGVGVNGSNRPMPAGEMFRITDGDIWQVGDFKLSVYVTADDGDTEDTNDHKRQWAMRFASVETLVPGALNSKGDAERFDAEAILADKHAADEDKDAFFARDRSQAAEIDPVKVMNTEEKTQTKRDFDPVTVFDKEYGASDMADERDLADELKIAPKSSGEASGIDDPERQNDYFSPPVAKTPVQQPSTSAQQGGDELDSYLESLAESAGEVTHMSIPDMRANEEWHGGVTSSQQLGEDDMVDHVVLRPLLAAMGLPVADMSVPESNRVAREAGAAMKSAVAGLINVHTRQWQDRSTLNDTHLHPVEDNPIRLENDPDQAIKDLFLVQSPVHLNAAAAVEESLAQIELHEQASRTAIDEALDAVLAALAPVQLAKRFARYKGHAPRTGDLDAWHWQMYQHYYSEMKSDRQRGLGRMFWEVFRQVYDREMRSRALENLTGISSK